MSGFFTELRRRNVFRVAAAYAVIAWILIEVLSTVLPMFGVPEWTLRVLVILLVAGFVPAVVFAWAFEMTPEGLKRDSEIDRSLSDTDQTAKKLDMIVIALLVVAIGGFTVDRFLLGPRTFDAPEIVSIDRIDSIAVLPFEDFSAGGDHAYLGTGIADTILHSLAQIQGLRVAARTSSFQLHEQKADIPTIGRTLGVGAVLEGSVQTSGNRLRVIAQLIRTSDQSHLWSQTFESTTDDIFATQDTIAAAVAATLRGRGAPKPVAQERTSPEVFELVSKGRHLWQQRNPTDTAEAVDALERAVVLDAGYAQAWSELAAANWFAFLYGNAERNDAKEAALAAATRALELDDSLAQPWALRGLIASNDGDTPAAIDHYERAIALNENYANAYAWLAQSLVAAGLHIDGRAMIERAYRLDPMATYVRGAYARALMSDDEPASRRRALEIVEETLRLTPGAFRAITDAADVTSQVGDLGAAIGYLAEGLRQRPDSQAMRGALIQTLFMLGESEAVERWGAFVDGRGPVVQKGAWRYAIRDWSGWVESNRRMLAEHPDSAFAKANLAFALTLVGDYEEALPLAEEALAWMEVHRYRDVPSAAEVNTMLMVTWLHNETGNAPRAAELRGLVSPRFETLKRNGLGADFFSTMLVVDRAIILGEMDRAVEALRGVGATNQRYFAFIWQDVPYWREFQERDDVKSILAGWRAEQADARARVREVAPAFIYDPALL